MCQLCDRVAQTILDDRDATTDSREPHTWLRYELDNWGAVSQHTGCPRIVDLAARLRAAAQIELQATDAVKLQKHASEERNYWHFVVGQSAATVTVIDVLATHAEGEVDVSLDAQWIDMQRVKSWMEDCDDNHAGICHSIADPWHSMPPPSDIILINVERQRLERCAGSTDYVALSYMWGNIADPFMTIRANFGKLCEEGAFEDSGVQNRLPQTIKDTMLLTSLLGQTRVWIDRFCIIQDDIKHKVAQLDAMASIYANAVVTVIAADGSDDTFGLRGIATSMTRVSPFYQWDFAPHCRLITNPVLNGGRYRTRGWTFQEEILSPRKLEFRAGTVFWTCRRTSRRENASVLERLPRVVKHDMGHGDLFTAWPNIRAFADVAQSYSTRQLSYQSDAMNAFSAIITVMSRTMKGGFLFGTPEMFFDGMLLWQPYAPLHRRRGSDGTAAKAFPSWSWIGWTGILDVRMWTEGHQFVTKADAFPNYLSIYPTVSWYKRDVNTHSTFRIESRYYDCAQGHAISVEDFAANNDHVLPPGWSFRHPIPLASHPFPPTKDACSPVLEFRTQQMKLFLGAKIYEFGSCAAGFLEDAKGQVVGAIRLNSKELPTAGTVCELISISRAEAECTTGTSHAEILFPELEDESFCQSLWGHKAKPLIDAPNKADERSKLSDKASRIYSFYNVLWIEWEASVAYRVALGRVQRQYWDNVAPVEIDIRLG